MDSLASLKPQNVFDYFEQICNIPHGSANTKQISDYCVDFAAQHGLWCYRDELNNVVIKKPASYGYENHPAVIIQGHLDMVCEKSDASNINFLTDPIDVQTDGEYVFANGTTLGADDGIAIAMALSILSDDTLVHPALEVVFTVDEETGMYGADALDTQILTAKRFINIDSESEGVLTAGCAGGARAEIEIPLEYECINGDCYKIIIDGLKGGHSGMEIHKNRLNANIVMGRLLNEIPGDFNLISLEGGLKDNAIPRSCSAVICTEGDILAKAKEFEAKNRTESEELKITVLKTNNQLKGINKSDSKKAARFLSTVLNGVVSMSSDIEGLVQTSLNLGILNLNENCLKASFSLRSSVNRQMEELEKTLENLTKSFSGRFSTHGHYPAWEYKKESELRKVMTDVFSRLYSKPIKISVIHAGLECGLFSKKIKGLDAVSVGPDMYDVHTPNEKLSVASTMRTYEFLCEVLKQL